MIPFEEVEEPEEFDKKAREPGNAWLRKHPGAKRPRDFWTPFKPELASGFRNLCAYSAVYEGVGTANAVLTALFLNKLNRSQAIRRAAA